MIRYQPPATNLTVPTSAAYGENITPGAVTGEDREQELWRKQMQVRSAFSGDLKHCTRKVGAIKVAIEEVALLSSKEVIMESKPVSTSQAPFNTSLRKNNVWNVY